jgi:hypothetical protein
MRSEGQDFLACCTPDIDVRLDPSMPALHHQKAKRCPEWIPTSKGAMPPHRRQPGGAFGDPDAQGEIRSMLEQYRAVDLATGAVMPAQGAVMPATGAVMPMLAAKRAAVAVSGFVR